jgi:putative ABC transport system permease protein
MIKNYLSIILRILRKKTLFSIINIAGLAIGLAASIMIWLWVSDELSYDRFHENSGKIYRVEREINEDGFGHNCPLFLLLWAPRLQLIILWLNPLPVLPMKMCF